MPYTLLPPPPAPQTPDQILAEEQRWLRECAGDGEPRALLWQGPQCLIVTRKDTRLPRYQAACEQLAAEGWPVFVRDSGGTAVPHGAGILNLSLMLPAPPRIWPTTTGCWGPPCSPCWGNTVLRAATTSCPARFATASTTW